MAAPRPGDDGSRRAPAPKPPKKGKGKKGSPLKDFVKDQTSTGKLNRYHPRGGSRGSNDHTNRPSADAAERVGNPGGHKRPVGGVRGSRGIYDPNPQPNPDNNPVVVDNSGSAIAGEWQKAAAAKAAKHGKKGKKGRKTDPNPPKGKSGSGTPAPVKGGSSKGRGSGLVKHTPDESGHGHAHGGGKKGRKGSQGTSGGSKTGTTANDYRSRADAAVDLMLNPKENALLAEQDSIKSEYTKQRNDLDVQTSRQLSDLATTYKQLDNTLAALNTSSDNALKDAGAAQTKAFDDLLAALTGTAQGQDAAVNSELERLGIAGAGDETQRTGDAAAFQALAQNNKAAAAAQMAAMQGNQTAFGNNTRGNYAAQGTQSQTIAKQSAVDMLNDLLFQRNQGVRKIGSQLSDVRGQRGALEHQLMEQYEQQAYERMMEQRQQNFLNQMNVNNFNLEQDQFNADQAYRQAQLALEGQSLELDAEAQRAKAAQAAAKAGPKTPQFESSLDWISDNVKSPRRRSALQAIMRRIYTHKQRGEEGGVHDFDQSNPDDLNQMYRYGLRFFDDPGFKFLQGPSGKTALRAALEAYFGRR